MREVLALSMQRHVQLFAHCTCLFNLELDHSHCAVHVPPPYNHSTNQSLSTLLFSSAEHSQCSVSEKCYPGPFREAINCYVESTLLGSKALLYSSLLHRLAIKLPPRPDFYSDDYLFVALTVNSDQSLCLAIVSYDSPSNPEEFRLHCFVWDNIVLLSLWTWNISLLLALLLKQLSHTS